MAIKEETKLAEEQARLALEHLWVIPAVLKKGWPTIRQDSHLYDSCLNVGEEALRRAAKRYDPGHGRSAKFSTFAWRWVEAEIRKHLGRQVRARNAAVARATAASSLSKEDEEALEDALARMADDNEVLAEVFRLKYVHGWSDARIGERLLVSASTARRLLPKAMELAGKHRPERPAPGPIYAEEIRRGRWRAGRRRWYWGTSRQDARYWGACGSFDHSLVAKDEDDGRPTAYMRFGVEGAALDRAMLAGYRRELAEDGSDAHQDPHEADEG